jgi:hypothetical protein
MKPISLPERRKTLAEDDAWNPRFTGFADAAAHII